MSKGLPADTLLGFIFNSLLDERADKQIAVCASSLRELFEASVYKQCTQQVILEGVAGLVTKHGEVMLKKVPFILMALYA